MITRFYTLLALLALSITLTNAQPGLLDQSFGGGDGEVNFLEFGLEASAAFRRNIIIGADRLYVVEGESSSGNMRVTVLDKEGVPIPSVNNGNPIATPPPAGFYLGAQVIPRPDGGYFVVGSKRNSTAIVIDAYKADGSRDAAFTGSQLTFDLDNRNGIAVTNFSGSITGLERADGGLSVLLGSVRNTDGSFDYLLNMGPNGILDSAAPGGGLLFLPFALSGFPRTKGVVLDRQGALLRFIGMNDSVAIERRLPTGEVDLGFAKAGAFKMRVHDSGTDLSSSITLAGDGGYYISALPRDVDRFNADTTYLPIIKLTADGRRDSIWAVNGLTSFIGQGTTASALTVYPRDNGGAYVCTNDNINTSAYALRPSGALDVNVGQEGRLVLGTHVEGQAIELPKFDPAAENFYAIQKQVLPLSEVGTKIKRFNANPLPNPGNYLGSVDLSYGGDVFTGVSLAVGASGISAIRAHAQRIDANGNRRVAYNVYDNNLRQRKIGIYDFDKDGKPAAGTVGGLRFSYLISDQSITDVLLLDDGVIIASAAGRFADSARLTRVNGNGELVRSWGDQGSLRLPALAVLDAAYLQPDGSILVAGRPPRFNIGRIVQRISPNGQLDLNTGTAGEFTLTGQDIDATEAAVGGGIYVVSLLSSATEGAVLEVRLLKPDGQLDNGFGNAGVASYIFPNDRFVRETINPDDVHLASDQRGGLLINGRTERRGSSGPNAFGSFLLSFDKDGQVRTEMAGGQALPFPFYTRASAASTRSRWLVQADGRMLLSTRTFNNDNWYVFRFLTNGTLDPTWGPNGLGWTTQFTVQTTERLLIEDGARFEGNLMTQTPAGNIILSGSGFGPPAALRLRNNSAPLVGLREVSASAYDPGMRILYGQEGERNVQLESPLAGQHQVALLNMNGQQIWSSTWLPFRNSTLELPAQLLAGTYAVSIRQPDGSRKAMLVVY